MNQFCAPAPHALLADEAEETAWKDERRFFLDSFIERHKGLPHDHVGI